MSENPDNHETCLITTKDENLALDYQPNGYAFLNETDSAVKWIFIKQKSFPNAFSVRPADNIEMCLTYSEFKNAAVVKPLDTKQNLATQYWGISHYDTLYSILDVEKELDLDRLESKKGAKAKLVKRNYGNLSPETSIFEPTQNKNSVVLSDSESTLRLSEKENEIQENIQKIDAMLKRVSTKIQATKVGVPGSEIEFYAKNSNQFSHRDPEPREKRRQKILKNRSPSATRSPSPPKRSLGSKFSEKERMKREKILRQKLDSLQSDVNSEAATWIKAWELTTGYKFHEDVRHVKKIDNSLNIYDKGSKKKRYQNSSHFSYAPKIPDRKPILKPASRQNSVVSFDPYLPSYKKEKELDFVVTPNIVTQSELEIDVQQTEKLKNSQKILWIQNQNQKRRLYNDVKSKNSLNYNENMGNNLVKTEPDYEATKTFKNPSETPKPNQPREVFRVFL